MPGCDRSVTPVSWQVVTNMAGRKTLHLMHRAFSANTLQAIEAWNTKCRALRRLAATSTCLDGSTQTPILSRWSRYNNSTAIAKRQTASSLTFFIFLRIWAMCVGYALCQIAVALKTLALNAIWDIQLPRLGIRPDFDVTVNNREWLSHDIPRSQQTDQSVAPQLNTVNH